MKGAMRSESLYVLQTWPGPCQVITFMNYHVELTGKSPVEYNSKKFAELLFKGKRKDRPGIDFVSVFKEHLKIRLVDIPKFRSMRRFKRFLIRKLKAGEMIQFRFPHPAQFLHYVLLTHYYPQRDSFRVINAQLLTNETPVEYLKFEELTKLFYLTKKDVGKYAYYNKKENTAEWAAWCIGKTKIIRTTDKRLKRLKRPPQCEFWLKADCI